MKEADGKYRRMVCHKVMASPLPFSTSTLAISQTIMEQGASYMQTTCASQPSTPLSM